MKHLITLQKKLKTVTSFVKLRVLNKRSRLNVIIRREPKKKLKLLKYFSILILLIIMQYMNMDFNRWLDFEKEIYEGYGYFF